PRRPPAPGHSKNRSQERNSRCAACLGSPPPTENAKATRQSWPPQANSLTRRSGLQLLPEPPRQVLNVLPGDAAGAGAARHLPLEPLAHLRLVLDLELVVGGIAPDH